jgi:uncharacterized protein
MSAMLPPSGFNPNDLSPPSIQNGKWKISSVAPDISGNCNLSCRYCAEKSTLPQRNKMEIETFDYLWNFFILCRKQKGNFSFRFGSGEPLLNFPLLEHLAKLIKTSGFNKKEISVFITSNGTLINDEIKDWLISSKWNIKISLDGPEYIHDKWRVSTNGERTHSKVASTVKYLAEQIPEKLSVTSVLCNGTNPRVVFNSIAKLGVKRIEFVPVSHKNQSFFPTSKDINLYKDFIKSYAQQYFDNKYEIPALVNFEKCVVRIMGYNLSEVGCGAGRSLVAVDPNGDIFPCFRFIGLDDYRLGSLYTGIETKRVLEFQRGPGRSYRKRNECVECWAAPLCNGPCFACTEILGSRNGSQMPLHCVYTMVDAKYAIWLVNQLREHKPELLLSFLPKIT